MYSFIPISIITQIIIIQGIVHQNENSAKIPPKYLVGVHGLKWYQVSKWQNFIFCGESSHLASSFVPNSNACQTKKLNRIQVSFIAVVGYNIM